VDAYLVRLDAVGRALTIAQGAYAGALAERDELRGRLGAYAAKAAVAGASGAGDADGGTARSQDLAELERRAANTLDEVPADLVRARALVAAYQAYLDSTAVRPGGATHPTRGGTP
jgi:hypothetical protein